MLVFYVFLAQIQSVFPDRQVTNIQNLIVYVNQLFQIQKQNVSLQLDILCQLIERLSSEKFF